MLFFIELGDGVNYYNKSIEEICKLRDNLKLKKEEMKNKF